MKYDVLQLATEQKQLEESNAALRDEVGSKEPVPLPTREQINALLEVTHACQHLKGGCSRRLMPW